jgi:hypothetical protein
VYTKHPELKRMFENIVVIVFYNIFLLENTSKYFLFLKNIFDISISREFKNIKKKLILNKKN